MPTQVKKYEGKKILSRSTSESAINALFVKNIFARNHKKSYAKRKKNPLEINELPPIDDNHQLLNDTHSSFHVKKLNDTFDKLKNGENELFDKLKGKNCRKLKSADSDNTISGNNTSSDNQHKSFKDFNSDVLDLEDKYLHTKLAPRNTKTNVDFKTEISETLSYSQMFDDISSSSDIQGAARRKKLGDTKLVELEPGVESTVDIAISKVHKSSYNLGKLALCSTPISKNRNLKTMDVITPIKVHDCASNEILEQSVQQVYNWSFNPPEVSAYEQCVQGRPRRLAINGYKLDNERVYRKSQRCESKRKCNEPNIEISPKTFVVKKFASNQRTFNQDIKTIPLTIAIKRLPDELVYKLIQLQNEKYKDLQVNIVPSNSNGLLHKQVHENCEKVVPATELLDMSSNKTLEKVHKSGDNTCDLKGVTSPAAVLLNDTVSLEYLHNSLGDKEFHYNVICEKFSDCLRDISLHLINGSRSVSNDESEQFQDYTIGKCEDKYLPIDDSPVDQDQVISSPSTSYDDCILQDEDGSVHSEQMCLMDNCVDFHSTEDISLNHNYIDHDSSSHNKKICIRKKSISESAFEHFYTSHISSNLEGDNKNINTRRKYRSSQEFEEFYTTMYNSVLISDVTKACVENEEETNENITPADIYSSADESSMEHIISTRKCSESQYVNKRRRILPRKSKLVQVYTSPTDSSIDEESNNSPIARSTNEYRKSFKSTSGKKIKKIQFQSPNLFDSDSEDFQPWKRKISKPIMQRKVKKIQFQSPDLFDTDSEDSLPSCLSATERSLNHCPVTEKNICDITQLSNDEVGASLFLPANSATVFRKPILLQPGKSWRRSLAVIKRSTFISEKSDGTRIADSTEATLNWSRIPRRTGFTLSSAAPRRSNRLSKYEQNRLRETVALESLIHNISLNVTQFNTSHNTYPKARELVLQYCKQTGPINFSKWYPNTILRNCHKIGEGVYGEVFLYQNVDTDASATVMKIIPIEGEMLVNGERQKQFDEILSEIVIAAELSHLRANSANLTPGFNQLKNVRCLKGKYPERLIELWELFEENKGTENDHPKMFDADQLYIVLELANAGTDLESFVFTNYIEVHQVFLQIAISLAVAEEELQFEHRDLHWGNVLINRVPKNKINLYKLNSESVNIPTNAVDASIIDFTLSRITFNNISIFNDLSQDPDLFNAEGDYQFEIYKLMKLTNHNDWESFNPKTNIFWLHYILVKMTTDINLMKKTVIGKSKKCFHTLVDWQNTILQYVSAKKFVQDVILPYLRQK